MRDQLGALRVRLGIGRARYRVAPGLVAVGEADEKSDVFVTANYKLSFDHLRRALHGVNAWILVLDTRGVNVWCAAAKGTFSTAEVCRRLLEAGLGEKLAHRRLVLPQLGAAGVAAHEVTRQTGFKVEYGPVRAADLPAWLAAGRKKDESMRRVRFDWRDRLTLVPVEIHNGLLHAPVLLAVALVLAVARSWGAGAGLATSFAGYSAAMLVTLLLAATLVPWLLPWLPTRAFSVKGVTVGLAGASLMGWAAAAGAPAWLAAGFRGGFTFAGAALFAAGYAAYVGLNFTGATVFTSQSGTMLETRRALPFIIGAVGVGFVFQLAGAFAGEAP